jgi:hypothetical protein
MKAHAHSTALLAPFWTPDVLVMIALIITASLLVVARYIGGLGAVTHLSDAYPWGLWIGIDVATGVALAAAVSPALPLLTSLPGMPANPSLGRPSSPPFWATPSCPSPSLTVFGWMKERGRDVSALIGKTDYIDFKALGYKDDPILVGGRFKKLPLGRAGAGTDVGKEQARSN